MTEADIEAAAATQVDAFGGVIAEVVARYHDGPRFTWRDAWVFESGGEVGAVAIAIPARWWFRRQAYQVSAIASVAVRPVDRRRGLASQLMHAILHAERDAGSPFSLLYPFQHGFYRRLGYGSVGMMNFWRLPTATMVDDPRLRRKVRSLRPGDQSAVEEIFARGIRESVEGGLERPPAWWQQRWSHDEKWVVFEDTDVRGYLAYRPVPNGLDVRELIAASAEAERGLWSFLAAQVEQRASISHHSPVGAPLWATLREPHMFEAPPRGFIITDVAGLTISFMARGVDWRAALSARPYPPEASGRVRVGLADAVFGPTTLGIEFGGGQGQVQAADSDWDVQCDAAVFSQLWCGALSAQQARWYGLLQGSEAAVALLDQAFPPGPPFIHPYDWF